MRDNFKQSKIGSIPEDWMTISLGDVLNKAPEYGAGASAISFSSDTYRYIRITDIDHNGNLIETTRSGILKSEGVKYLLSQNDILIARTGNTVGKSYIHKKENGACAFAGYLIRFSLDTRKYIPSLLFHFLHSPQYWKWVKDTARTGAQPNINSQEYQGLTLPLPPLPEQQKIAEILSTVDEKVTVIDKQIGQTQELKKGLMQRLLTKGIGHAKFKSSPLGEIPESWEVTTLDKLTDKKRPIRYGIVQTGDNIPDGIPCLRVADFNQRKFSQEQMIRTSAEISSKHPTTILQEGDIVFPLRGQIGNVKLVDSDLVGINLTRGVALISKSINITPQYLFWQLQSPMVIKEMMLKVNGTTLQEIPIGGLKSIPVAIAPKAEQEKIAKTLSCVAEKLEVLQEKKERYQEMKKGLMQQLLTGKLRVNHMIEQPELV